VNPFASRRSESVAALGEEGLIAAIRGWLGGVSPPAPRGIGDDCAVVGGPAGPRLMTVDPVVYRRHFDASTAPEAVGAKLLKRNLSDIAAMGGRPLAAVVALALDPRVRRDWVAGFYRGLAACARRHRVRIVGGDVAEAPGTLVASLTLLGTVGAGRAVARRGARPGDRIYVTGRLGGSLRSGHHLSFRPRLGEGAWLARRKAVRAMMDVSDGIAKDIASLTPAGAAAALNPGAIPRRDGCTLREALCDGEDYELLFALDRSAAAGPFERRWRRAFPRVPLTQIGRFVRSPELPPGSIRLSDYRGYEHLR
jgi:thiamine-monophosphate kinase